MSDTNCHARPIRSKHEGAASVPTPIVHDDDYTTITIGKQEDIPPYIGIGATIMARTHGDLLIVSLSEPGYGQQWVGRLDAITQSDRRIAALERELDDLRARAAHLATSRVALGERLDASRRELEQAYDLIVTYAELVAELRAQRDAPPVDIEPDEATVTHHITIEVEEDDEAGEGCTCYQCQPSPIRHLDVSRLP